MALQWLLLGPRARRHFRQQKALHGQTEIVWSDAAIRLRAPKGMVELDWTDFVSWAENDITFILMQTDNLMNGIPKRILTAADIDDLRRCLSGR